MDNSHVFIANLSKGKLGEDKANLLGAMLVTSFQVAAMSRLDTPESERKDWFLYVDEFQSFATDSFASIFSEARKQRLCLTLAHQHISQLRREIRDAIFGNVGTMVSFRVSEADADVIAREFGDDLRTDHFTDMANYEVRVKLLDNGQYGRPFLGTTLSPVESRHGGKRSIIRRSRNSFATRRSVIEEKIRRWMRG